LRQGGFDVTQAPLSRYSRELGLVKGGADGAYQPPLTAVPNGNGATLLPRLMSEQLLRIDRVQQLVVLRTPLGHAQSLCAALDSARLPDVVGTLAGEDTILVITPDTRRARSLIKRLEGMARR
jgi:transcriptional regulator of arginine metabolism